jgi:hypothetical protein
MAAAMVATTGCSPSTQPSRSEQSRTAGPTIVDGQTPTDDAKQKMLAAKEALFATLSARLAQAMGTQGVAAAIAVCKDEAPRLTAQVSREHNLAIGRTGVRLRNTENNPPDWAASLVAKQANEPQFVLLDNGATAALLPIRLQAQCTMCHGTPDMLLPEAQQALAELYPDDAATGFAVGELRGWFWVELPR